MEFQLDTYLKLKINFNLIVENMRMLEYALFIRDQFYRYHNVNGFHTHIITERKINKIWQKHFYSIEPFDSQVEFFKQNNKYNFSLWVGEKHYYMDFDKTHHFWLIDKNGQSQWRHQNNKAIPIQEYIDYHYRLIKLKNIS